MKADMGHRPKDAIKGVDLNWPNEVVWKELTYFHSECDVWMT